MNNETTKKGRKIGFFASGMLNGIFILVVLMIHGITTLAWFHQSITNTGNTIKAGSYSYEAAWSSDDSFENSTVFTDTATINNCNGSTIYVKVEKDAESSLGFKFRIKIEGMSEETDYTVEFVSYSDESITTEPGTNKTGFIVNNGDYGKDEITVKITFTEPMPESFKIIIETTFINGLFEATTAESSSASD